MLHTFIRNNKEFPNRIRDGCLRMNETLDKTKLLKDTFKNCF